MHLCIDFKISTLFQFSFLRALILFTKIFTSKNEISSYIFFCVYQSKLSKHNSILSLIFLFFSGTILILFCCLGSFFLFFFHIFHKCLINYDYAFIFNRETLKNLTGLYLLIFNFQSWISRCKLVLMDK